MTTRRIKRKAAALAALWVADQAGLLEGLTQQEIANCLGHPDRSTGSRYLADLERMRFYVPAILAEFRQAQRRRNQGKQ